MVREILKLRTDNELGESNPSFKDIEITDYSFSSPRMGMPTLTATLMWPTCLDDEWTGKEYVELRGEKYYIRQTPHSEKNNNDERYIHEIIFEYPLEILNGILFMDVVPSWSATYDKPCSNSSDFKIYGSIREALDRLNCAFRYGGIGDSILNTKTSLTDDDGISEDGYCAVLCNDNENESYLDNKELAFSDISIWGAISKIFETFNIPYIRVGKTFYFGKKDKSILCPFKYGYDSQLLKVAKKNTMEKPYTRITAIGSDENIPYFYPNETEYGNVVFHTSGFGGVNVEMKKPALLVANVRSDEKAVYSFKDNAEAAVDASTLEYWPNDHVSQTKPLQLNTRITLKGYEKETVVEGDTSETAYFQYLTLFFNVDVTRDGFVEISSLYGSSRPQNVKAVDGMQQIDPTASDWGNFFNAVVINPDESYVVKYIPGYTEPKIPNAPLGYGKTGVYKTIDGKIGLGDLHTNNGQKTTAYIRLHLKFRIYPNFVMPGAPIISGYSTMFMLSEIAVSPQDEAFHYWAVGNKVFRHAETIGVKMPDSIGENDIPIGASFWWTAESRQNFLGRLSVPLLTRAVVQDVAQPNVNPGEERFYNAVNGKYNNESGGKYQFANPYSDSNRNEYILSRDDIKPSINGIENSSKKLFGAIADIAFDDDDSDALKSVENEETDSGNALKYAHSFFYIRLNVFDGQYGFDLFDSASQTEPMVIQMTSGSCAGCKFKIQSIKEANSDGYITFRNPVQTENGEIVPGNYTEKVNATNIIESQQNTRTNSIWICVQKDTETFGVIMPNVAHNYKPEAGDTFNIVNIDLPRQYIYVAEDELESEMLKKFSEINDETFTFDIENSRIFLAENPEIAKDVDEYSTITVVYDGRQYPLYISAVKIESKDADPLPELSIDVTDSIIATQSFTDRITSDVKAGFAQNPTRPGMSESDITDITDKRYYGKNESDKRFFRKDIPDRSPNHIASDIGFEAGSFVPGATGGIFKSDSVTGRSYIETDDIKVRGKAVFQTVEITKVESVRGKEIVSSGGSMTITAVEETDTAYVCYFKKTDTDTGGTCSFKAGDEILCQTWNVTSGTHFSSGNKYYWRCAVEVDNEKSRFLLSKNDCAENSDAPAEGDTVVHFGHHALTDGDTGWRSRTNAISISSVDGNSPNITMFQGVSNYSMLNADMVDIGVKKDTDGNPRAYINVYGDAFIGDRNETKGYLRYTIENGLELLGKLSVNTTVGGKTLSEYFTDLIPDLTQDDIEGFVNNIVDPKLEGIQNQIDGVIETWFYNGVPTLTNYPASGWNTNDLKIQHLGDLYYDNDTGTAYRFSQNTDGSFYWNKITDEAITKALAAAQKAQDTADGKRRVFTSQPEPPYDKGDLWVNATYPAGTTYATRDPANGKYYNDILRCGASRATGTFSIGDWGLSSNYTDDTLAQQAIQTIAGYEYLKNALLPENPTQITGGLIMSTLISLGYTDNVGARHVMAGMNGSWVSSLGGRTVGSWWGGPMVDLFDENDIRKNLPTGLYATSMVRMDGSAYFAGGNVGFRADGSGWFGSGDKIIKFANGQMTFGSGVTFDVDNVSGLKTTLDSLANFNVGLSALLIPCDSNDNEISWSEATKTDTVNGGIKAKSLKAKVGFWSDSWISAKGRNPNMPSGGSGGSGFGLMKQWPSASPGLGTMDALGANLGWELYVNKADKTALTALTSRVSVLEGKNYLDALTLAQGGSGNAVTAVSLSADKKTLTVTKGATFLTSHQSLANYYTKTEADGKFLTSQTFSFQNSSAGYVNVRFTNSTANQNAHNGYIEWWATDAGWFNHKANRFITNGGTSAMFVKGDGSLDSNTYLTTSAASSTYIPLSRLATGSAIFGRIPRIQPDGVMEVGKFIDFHDTKEHTGDYSTRLTSDSGSLYINSHKIWHSQNDGPGSGLDADLLDGWHLGDNNGCVARYAIFPSFGTLISMGYLDSTYESEGHPDEKYFKALLKWVCATYSGSVTLMGMVVPNSRAFLVLAVYDTALKQDGLPQYSYAVVYRYAGSTVRFGTHVYAWSWNNAVWHGRLDGNASTATRLQGTFKLWGQDFYGNHVSGNMTGVGSISASGEIKTTSRNAFRSVHGGYGFLMRNDGTNFYLLLTDKNNADGTWNALRPLTISNATGNVSIGGNALYVSHKSRVGIKTTAPAYDLDVNGTARATSLTLGGGTISWDADAQMFKFSKGLYSEGAVTAKGKSSIPGGGGGSGTGYSRLDEWADYATDKAGWVLSAKLGNELNNRLLNVYTKSAVDSMLGAKADSTAVVTALGTSGNNLTWTKNGAVNSITVPYATRSGYADVLRDPVYHDYSHRRTSANVNFNNDCGVHTFLATSTMTTGKPSGDAHILHMEWDNALSWAAQIAVPTNAPDGIQWRVQGNPEWQTWIRILDENNYSSILDGRYYTESEINSKLSGYVTLNTVQSIKGAKTFESVVKIAPTNVSGYQDGLVLHDNGSGNGEALRIRWTSFSYSDGITLTPTMNANRLTSSADLYAPKFIKDGSSDSYLLLGGGGHKALSDLATASALSSGLSGKVDKSGDSMTGALSIKSGAYNKTLELMSTGADSKGKGAGIRFRGSDTDTSEGVTLRHEWYDTFVPGYGLAISHEGSLEAGDASMWLYNTGRYISKVPTGTKPIDVVSTTLCTNLNADMLDGVHNGSVTANRLNFFFEKSSSTADASNLAIIKEHYTSIPAQQACAIGLRHGSLSMAFGWKLGGSYNSIDKAYCGWFVSNYGTPGWISADNGVWKSETFAFLSSNVASATKLADDTAFTAWGQTFFENGKPKNVNGNMTDVGHIYLNSGKYLYAPDADGTQRKLIDFYSGQKPTFAYGFASVGTDVEYCGNNIYLSYGMTHVKGFVLNDSGNVGIGKPDPAYRVDVNGDIRTNGQLRLGTWGRMLYDGGGWLQMAPNATNHITAMNGADMTRLEIKSAVSHFSGQINNSNSAGNGTTIAYGAIELTHATPYIDFHFGRSTEDFDVRLINDEAGVLRLVGDSGVALRLGNGYIRWDSSKGCFAFSHGIYSESFITAKAKGNIKAASTASSDNDAGNKETGGIIATSEDGDGSELEQLRQRVAYLEQRLNALTAND